MDETRLKVLTIDDSPVVLARTRSVLEANGFEVACAHSPIGCSGRILRMKPDAILLDVEMPALRGDEFVTQLRAHASIARARVLFYSDRPARELEALTRVTGADGYIPKSAAAEELVRRLREAIALPRGYTPSVLFVEADKDSALQKAFRHHPRYSFASSGSSAISRIFDAEPPDLVICSMKLPDMTGLDVHAMARGVDPTWTTRFLIWVDRLRSDPLEQQFIGLGGHLSEASEIAADVSNFIASHSDGASRESALKSPQGSFGSRLR